MVPSSNHIPVQDAVDRERTDCASTYVRVKITGSMGIGSCIVARGLGPWPSGPKALPRTRGWGYGSYHRARVQGPKGLGTPYHTSILGNLTKI